MTKTEIGNLALSRIGSSIRMTDVDTDDTQEAIVTRSVFDNRRDWMLRKFSWPFATKYEAEPTLLQGGGADPANRDWQYAYLYPADCWLLRRLVTGRGRKDVAPPTFRIGRGVTNPEEDEEDQVQGRLVYTNEPDAQFEYTVKVTDPAEFDPEFASCLAWLIAAEQSPTLSRMKDHVTFCFQMFGQELRIATGTAFNEGQGELPADAEWVRARTGEVGPSSGDPWASYPSGLQ